MQSQTQTASARARILFLVSVIVVAASLFGRGPHPGKREVAARLVPARPLEWSDPAQAGLRIDTQVDEGEGIPAVVTELGEAPLRWPVEAREGARLRFGYRLRSAEPLGASEVTVSAEWESAAGERTELYRETTGADALGAANEIVEVELPESGAGAIVLTANAVTTAGKAEPESRPAPDRAAGTTTDEGGAPSERVAGAAAVAAKPELLWLDPIVLAPAARKRPNVVVVCIDTLRADRFAALGDGETALPRTEARFDSAAVFRRAYSNAPWTLPSVSTIITGLNPGLHNAGRRTLLGPTGGRPTNYSATPTEGGIQLTISGKDYRFQMLHPSVPTLHAILGEQGYVTGAIFRNGYLNHPTRVFLGADSFRHYTGEAPEGADLAIDWLEKHADESFYLFLHFIDPHQWPRRIAQELRGLRPKHYQEDDKEHVLGVYDDLAGQADEHLDRVFRALARLRLLDDTYVILLADHGERFFEKGVRGSHGGDHYENVLRVPLAIWGPGIEPRSIDSRVSLSDVAPTVLDLLEVDSDAQFSGSSLVPLLDGVGGDRTVLSEFILWGEPQTALMRDGWKYIRREGREELYFIPDDPTEDHDKSASEPEVLISMRAEVEKQVAAADSRFAGLTYGTTTLDPRTVGSLKALGYLE
jgi:arylsulfatase A-like enzyme